MKQTHKTIKDNKDKKRTGRGQVSWEYFDIMEDIFGEDKTINIGHTISSMIEETVPPSLNIPTTSTGIRDILSPIDIAQPGTSSTSVEALQPSLFQEVSTPTTLIAETPKEALQPSLFQEVSTPTTLIAETPNKKSKAQKGRIIYGLRREQLIVERERVKEIKLLREAVEKSNKIQEERNELLRKLLKL
ncbi:uncharacterized protein LOC126891464 [Diabrotica virgifera virgifera]|uniref:Uncharacterized protein n=1 Tax=Diabrotica virgifera virgifera TaxID=50390 RepID=A0ABM5L2D6_DIAVI|nr:uncharacterized protein LOC126891464 [Diabrotica virgifera virgifera]